MRNTYTVAGMMSGTSLDGMDLVLCRFKMRNGKWQYEILKADTIEYSSEWKRKLISAPGLPAEEFMVFHNEYGAYIGQQVKDFLAGFSGRVDLVSSHGHTIFHQPGRRLPFRSDQAFIYQV